MPSSSSPSWRLIRPDDDRAVPAVAQSQPTPQPTGPVAVLRGRSRSASRPQAGATAAGEFMSAEVAIDPAQAIAEEEIHRIQAAAEERGYQAGRQQAEAELRSAVDAASSLAARISAVAPEQTAQLAHSIAELALAVARRVVGREVMTDPTLLCSALETAVSTINGSPEAHVLLHPLAVSPVRVAWEARHGNAYLGKKWLFEADPTLPPGGCSVRYDHGFVEAGLESQLEEIGIALDRAIPSLARAVVDEEVA